MCTLKWNLRPKIGLIYAISIVKWFLEFCLRKYFFFLFFFGLIWIIDISQQHCENFRKIEQVELGEKSASKIPTLQISA